MNCREELESLRINENIIQNFLKEEMEPADFLLLSQVEQANMIPKKGPRYRLISFLCRNYPSDDRVVHYIQNYSKKSKSPVKSKKNTSSSENSSKTLNENCSENGQNFENGKNCVNNSNSEKYRNDKNNINGQNYSTENEDNDENGENDENIQDELHRPLGEIDDFVANCDIRVKADKRPTNESMDEAVFDSEADRKADKRRTNSTNTMKNGLKSGNANGMAEGEDDLPDNSFMMSDFQYRFEDDQQALKTRDNSESPKTPTPKKTQKIAKETQKNSKESKGAKNAKTKETVYTKPSIYRKPKTGDAIQLRIFQIYFNSVISKPEMDKINARLEKIKNGEIAEDPAVEHFKELSKAVSDAYDFGSDAPLDEPSQLAHQKFEGEVIFYNVEKQFGFIKMLYNGVSNDVHFTSKNIIFDSNEITAGAPVEFNLKNPLRDLNPVRLIDMDDFEPLLNQSNLTNFENGVENGKIENKVDFQNNKININVDNKADNKINADENTEKAEKAEKIKAENKPKADNKAEKNKAEKNTANTKPKKVSLSALNVKISPKARNKIMSGVISHFKGTRGIIRAEPLNNELEFDLRDVKLQNKKKIKKGAKVHFYKIEASTGHVKKLVAVGVSLVEDRESMRREKAVQNKLMSLAFS